MIFKIFDGNEGISSKIGILNKSFAEIGKAFSDALSTSIGGFGDGLFGLEEKDQGFLKNFVDNLRTEVDDVEDLYKKLIVTQKDIEPFLKPIDVYDNFDTSKAEKVLADMQKQKKLVDANNGSWQKFYDTLKPGEEWQEKFVQTMDLTKASVDDVKEAQAAARQAADELITQRQNGVQFRIGKYNILAFHSTRISLHKIVELWNQIISKVGFSDISPTVIISHIRRRGEIGGSAKKVGKRIKELERLYGIREGSAGGNGSNQYKKRSLSRIIRLKQNLNPTLQRNWGFP